MGLGSVEFVTLAQAREKAAEHRRRLKHDKIDPLEARRALAVGARIAALKGVTFADVGRQCIEQRSARWRGQEPPRMALLVGAVRLPEDRQLTG